MRCGGRAELWDRAVGGHQAAASRLKVWPKNDVSERFDGVELDSLTLLYSRVSSLESSRVPSTRRALVTTIHFGSRLLLEGLGLWAVASD